MAENDDPTIRMSTPDPGELLARAMHTDQPSGAAGGGRWTPPTPEELAALLPQFRIDALLGHGGMGAVYRGVQVALDRKVAIKLLPIEISTDPAFTDRFVREAKTLARLSHPNIVAIHDFGTTSEGHHYFVMEFVEGTDLHRMIHGPGLTPAQSLSITIAICEALQYAHGKGVVHRDIKPANVMVSTEGQVKVADFGLARLNTPDAESDGLTMTGTVMGTLAYMAPEQTRGMHVDHRADIYSLGVMLYEMLCGQVPRGVFDPPSHKVQVDVRIDEVVLKAMNSEPERRYQNTGEMKSDVDAIRTTPQQPASAPKPKSKSPVAAVLVAACLALASAAGFVIWKKTNQPALADHEKIADRTARAARLPLSAEPWRDALTNLKLVGPGEKSERTAEGLVLKKGTIGILDGTGRRNGAIRIQAVREGTGKDVKIQVRSHFGQAGTYKLGLSGDRQAQLAAATGPTDEATVLKEFSLPNPIQPGEPYSMELRIVGSTLTASVNSEVLGSVEDSTLPEGDFRVAQNVHSSVLVRALEFLPLPDDAVAAAPAVSSSPAAGGDPIQTFAGHRYQFVPGALRWTDAKAKAEEMGGHLATITTKEEAAWINTTFQNRFTIVAGASRTWIGAFADSTQRPWQWVTNEPFDFVDWADGMPERGYISDPKQRYAAGIYSRTLKWSVKTQTDTSSAGFLVEWDSEGGALVAPAKSPTPKGATPAPSNALSAWSDLLAEQRATGNLRTWATDHDAYVVPKKQADVYSQDFFCRNGAIRATWSDQFGIFLQLRGQLGKSGSVKARYQCRVDQEGVTLWLLDAGTGKYTDKKLKHWPLPASFDINQPHTAIFRALDDTLSVELDGQELGSVRDATLGSAGAFGFYPPASGRIFRVEYASFDAGTEASQLPPAPSASTPATATKDGTELIRTAESGPPAPKQWLDVTASSRAAVGPGLTEDTPGGWRATDLIPIISVSNNKARNVVLRVRHRGSIGLSLRVTGGEGSYAVGINSIGQASVKFSEFAGDKPTTMKLAGGPRSIGFNRDESHETVFATQGDELSLWLDGQLVGRAKDSRLTAGRTRIRVEKGTIIEKIEYAELPDDAVPATSPTPATATKDAPFVNTLGMKFVPVPITGGPTGGQRVLFSVWETRVQDYEVFTKETKRNAPKPTYPQGTIHPAVNLMWEDAQGFCDWLTERERKAGKLDSSMNYRLPTDHEWSCAVGIGEREDPAKSPKEKSPQLEDVFPWGSAWPPPKGAGNFSGEEAAGHFVWAGQETIAGYRDDFSETAPVGSFPANRFGLFDLAGNAWEYCGSLIDGTEKLWVNRGGSFAISSKTYCRSSRRAQAPSNYRGSHYGFRCVLAPVAP